MRYWFCSGTPRVEVQACNSKGHFLVEYQGVVKNKVPNLQQCTSVIGRHFLGSGVDVKKRGFFQSYRLFTDMRPKLNCKPSDRFL